MYGKIETRNWQRDGRKWAAAAAEKTPAHHTSSQDQFFLIQRILTRFHELLLAEYGATQSSCVCVCVCNFSVFQIERLSRSLGFICVMRGWADKRAGRVSRKTNKIINAICFFCPCETCQMANYSLIRTNTRTQQQAQIEWKIYKANEMHRNYEHPIGADWNGKCHEMADWKSRQVMWCRDKESGLDCV